MHHLSVDEFKSLLAQVPDARNRLMLKVAFNHGLRVSEVISITGKSIRDGHLTCQRLKGSLKTTQPFVGNYDEMLNEALELVELAEKAGPNERLFPMTRSGVQKLMLRAGAKAGLPRHKLHPHVLKHSIAKLTIHSAGIENVRQWLGHRSMSSTGEYLRVHDSEAATAILQAVANRGQS